MAMDFYVELKLWSPEEASKIKDFTDVTTIASTAGSSSADSESGVTSPHNVYLISSSESDQQKVVHKSSHQQIEVITIDDDDDDDIPLTKKPAIKRKGQGPGKENRKRLKKNAGTSLLLKVKSPPIERQDCNHLIPPELEFLSPNEFKFDVTDDSVSCSSSDSGDLFQDDLKDIRDLKVPQKPISPPKKSTHLEQPIGVDIDIKKLGPPSKAFVDSLPEPPLYPCNRPGCGFTTSDPVNKKYHSCIRPKFTD